MGLAFRIQLSSYGQVVYSNPMQDKEINRRFDEMAKRFDRLENARGGEPLVDSPFDKKLTRIAESISEIKSDGAGLRERVDNHIKAATWCISILFALCAGGATMFYEIHGTLSEIQASLPSGQIKSAVAGPLDEQKLDTIQSIVTAAKSGGLPIDPKVVSQAGMRLLKEAQVNPNPSL